RMRPTALLLSSVLVTVLVTGCGTVEPFDGRSRVSALEVPPDLTAPDTTGAIRVPIVSGSPVSAQTAGEFDAFQSTQQQAEYQAFLAWRKTHGDSEDTSIAAFHEAKRVQREAKLLRDGVLIAVDNMGREVLLISDTLDNSWNRVDTALINLNLQLLNSRKSTHTFRLSYPVGREGGTNRGWRNWATQLTGRAIYEVQLVEDEGVVVVSVVDRYGQPVISPVADTFMRRLAAQLKTFAGRQEQFVTGGYAPLAGLSLKKRSNGQLQLVIPEPPENAWKRLYKALRDANFSIASRDHEALSFWIRYAGPEKKVSRSLLVRLGLRKEKEPKVIERYRVQL
ncbi:MAG: outer membrane protein assembly factor BamC, partial [Acidobacteria bacterium]|nr:outer membrane protein assembly factor BamC [Acidobacteriota bacterium]